MDYTSNKKLFYMHIIFLLVIGFISYSNIFSNPFVIDDDYFIVKWNAIRSFKNLPLFIKGLTPEGHEGVYRPIRTLFYAIAYKLFGSNPFGYHLFSIIIHLSSTILVYLILVSALRNYLLPFVSALFFAIHPIHTESITYMTSSFDMVGILFILVSFYTYIQYAILKKRLFYGMSVFSAIIGYFAHEVTLIFPVLLVLYNMCFKVKNSIRIYIPYFAGMLFYIVVRFLMIGVGGKGGYVLNSFYYTMLMMPKAFFKYISLIIFPINLSMNHELYPGIYSMLYVGYDKDALSSFSFRDFRILLPLTIITAIVGVGAVFFKRRPIISFSILWFFISLIPVSNIIPTGIIMAERYLYLSSFGYCFLLGYLLVELYNRGRFRDLAYIIFCTIALFYFKTSIIRNLDWRNPLFLWNIEVKRFPKSPIANNNLGYAYLVTGDYDKALTYLERAKELSPKDIQTRDNIVVCYIKKGMYDSAINECKGILEINPYSYKAYVNISAVYNAKGVFNESILASKKTLDLKPDCPEAYNNLIVAYINKGDYAVALEYYNKAVNIGLAIDPDLLLKLEGVHNK